MAFILLVAIGATAFAAEEPGSSRETAIVFDPGQSIQGVMGSSEEIWYQAYLNGGQVYSFEKDTRGSLLIYEEDKATYTKSYYAGHEGIDFTAEASGTYYFKVNGDAGKAWFMQPAKPGMTRNLALPLDVSQPFTDTTSDVEYNWYKTELNGGQVYSFEKDTRGTLLIYQGDKTTSSKSYSSGHEGIDFTAGASGTYYFKVNGDAGKAWFMQPAKPGMTRNLALPLDVSQPFTDTTSDVEYNWYKTELNGGQVYSFEKDTRGTLLIYQGDKTTLSKSYSSGHEGIDFTAEASGTYYFKVNGDVGKAWFMQPAKPGMTRNLALPLDVSQPFTDTTSDVEYNWYKTELNGGQVYSFEKDTRGTLLIYQGDKTTSSKSYSSGHEGIDFTAEASETYYFKVNGDAGKAWFMQPAKPGMTRNLALPLDVSQPFTDTTSDVEYNWYKTELNGGQVYSFEKDTRGTLFIYQGEQNSYKSYYAGHDEIDFMAQTSGTYYFKVNGDAGKEWWMRLVSYKQAVAELDPGQFEDGSLVSDPIHAGTGAQIINQPVLKVEGIIPIQFTLHYNSMLLEKGLMGTGWEHSFETWLESVTQDKLVIHWSSNRATSFIMIDSGSYISQDQDYKYDQLVRDAVGGYVLQRNDQSKLYFNEQGQLIRTNNSYGQSVELKYNHTGLLSQIVEPITGVSIELTYTTEQVIKAVTDSANRTATFEYDPQGRMIRFTDVGGYITTYTYNAKNQIVKAIDGDGAILFNNQFDVHDRVMAQQDAFGYTTSFQYGNNRVTTITNREEQIRTIAHNSKLQLISETTAAGDSVEYEYDAQGRRIQEQHATGQRYTYTYDRRGNVLTQTDIAGHQISYTYDQRNNRLSMTEGDLGTTKFSYDDHNRLIEIKDSLGAITRYRYNEVGQLIEEEAPEGGMTRYTYQVGRLIAKQDAEGHVTSYTHDALGRVIQVEDPEGNTSRYVHDAAGQIIQETDPLGNMTRFAYNGHGDLISRTDAAGHVTSYQYNANGQLIQETNSLGHHTVYTYNKEDQLIRTTDPMGRVTDLLLDGDGRPVKRTNPLGNVVSYTYDSKGRPLSETSAMGRVSLYSYDMSGNLTRYIDPAGQQTTYIYSAKDELIGSTDELGHSTAVAYDAMGRVVSRTDSLGNRTHYSYDKNGNLIQERNAEGHITAYQYDLNNRLIAVTDPLQQTTTYLYDKNGRVVRTTDHNGVMEERTYDAKGRVVTITDGVGNTITYTYDPLDHITSESDAEGNVTQYVYDAAGQLAEQVSPRGYRIQYMYNANGQLTGTLDSYGREVLYTYDASGQMITKTDARQQTAHYRYDADGMLIAETDALGNEIHYTYDANRLESREDPLGNLTRYEYDATGRLTSIIDPLGHREELKYDAMGRLLSRTDRLGQVVESLVYNAVHVPVLVTDALGRDTRYSPDALGRTATVIDPMQRVTSYTYDSLDRITEVNVPIGGTVNQQFDTAGRLTERTDLNGQMTTYAYNGNGLPVWEQNAAGDKTQFIYDVDGQVKTYLNGRNQVFDYRYDLAGRLTSWQQGEEDVQYRYDDNDNLTRIEDSNGAIEREYDALNRVIHYKDTAGNNLGYRYDAAGRLIELTYPDGKTVVYTYDAAGRMQTVTDWRSRITSYEYDANGRLTATDKPDGSRETRDYDLAGQLSKLVNRAASGTIISEDAYTYDAVGNVLTEGNWMYTYDVADRLTAANAYRYVYDLGGNLTEATIARSGQAQEAPFTATQSTYELTQALPSATQVTYNFDDAVYLYDGQTMTYSVDNRLATVDGQPVVYDADGNLIEGSFQGGANHFVYDARNRLREAGELTYNYDAENYRTGVINTVTGATYQYVINPEARYSQVLMETSEDTTRYYIYGLGLIAHEEADGEAFIYHYDRRGSTIALTDETGEIRGQVAYDPYGGLLNQRGQTDTPFLYNGQYGVMTDSNGLYHMRARYYHPEIKRFMNRDVLEGNIEAPQTLNRYAYVNGNPISYIDPFGLSRERVEIVDPLLDELSVGLDFFPVIGSLKSGLEAVIGKDILTGDQLTAGNRLITTAGILLPAVKAVKRIDQANDLLQDARKVQKGIRNEVKLEKKAASKPAAGCNCFTAGTKVLTDAGEKNIEDIEVGDRILSKDETTGEVAYKEVTATFNHETDEIYKIHVGDQVIESTFNHPFYVEGKGWTFVKDLKAGDLLVQSDGNTLKIDSIELLNKHVTVYNMTVDEFHTYFVSGLGIWVHNTGPCDLKPTVTNTKLNNLVESLYKGQKMPEIVGNGTTMDSIRHELRTGEPVGGKFHSQKGQEFSNALRKLLNSGDLNEQDTKTAQMLYDDLQNALAGK
ncbi:polymorphic toxin-type HINT domain-containing protein [Paenibacillus senegalimassiliensis]|uniref:polymorphic toxin-type HINT domain-containing protein n=1 Tax=Paenibacillus senegalimassiliensis TaxID=1737426 RepID=UPI0011DD0393|nr:polymorphic toxin-type HINT domain-containing protein [Paenibacillus senegalimassiliensis]